MVTCVLQRPHYGAFTRARAARTITHASNNTAELTNIGGVQHNVFEVLANHGLDSLRVAMRLLTRQLRRAHTAVVGRDLHGLEKGIRLAGQ